MSDTVDIVKCMPGDEYFKYYRQVLQNVYAPGSVRLQQPDHVNTAMLQTCLVAIRDMRAVGRLSLYLNPFIHHNGKRVMLFGNFECIDDPVVCNAMMLEAFGLAASIGCHYAIGPMNGSTWEEYRVGLNDVLYPFFTDILTPAYYFRLLQYAGFEIFEKYRSDISVVKHELLIDADLQRSMQANGVSIRNIEIDNLTDELKAVYELSCTTFAENIFYSPIDETSFIAKYMAIKPYLDPDFVFIAEQNGKLIAFLLCYPDFFAPNRDRLIVKTMAKAPGSNIKGIIDLMIQMMQVRAVKKGYSVLIHAFIHQHNKSGRISHKYDGELFREYALMIKEVEPSHAR